MNRTTGFILIGASIAAVLVLGIAPIFSSTDETASSGTEAVMFRCITDGSTFEVNAYQGSAATPTKRSNSCPEVLAQLLRNGYEVSDISHSRVDSNFIIYTLQR